MKYPLLGNHTYNQALSKKRVALPMEQRKNIRAAVYALKKQIASSDCDATVKKELARVAKRSATLVAFMAKKRQYSKRA